MGFYDRVIGPALIACACSAGPISRQREKVVPLAAGDVLELGMGAGANLPFYDRERVTGVFAVEPNAAMRARAEKVAAETALPVSLIDGVGEHLPYDTGRFDCVVCTYTLCTVQDVARTLAEARRVLKPGGRFLFCEHGRAPDEDVLRWQRRIEPFWKLSPHPPSGGRDPGGWVCRRLAGGFLPAGDPAAHGLDRVGRGAGLTPKSCDAGACQ